MSRRRCCRDWSAQPGCLVSGCLAGAPGPVLRNTDVPPCGARAMEASGRSVQHAPTLAATRCAPIGRPARGLQLGARFRIKQCLAGCWGRAMSPPPTGCPRTIHPRATCPHPLFQQAHRRFGDKEWFNVHRQRPARHVGGPHLLSAGRLDNVRFVRHRQHGFALLAQQLLHVRKGHTFREVLRTSVSVDGRAPICCTALAQPACPGAGVGTMHACWACYALPAEALIVCCAVCVECGLDSMWVNQQWRLHLCRLALSACGRASGQPSCFPCGVAAQAREWTCMPP